MPFGAKMGDLVTGTDSHIVLVPVGTGFVPTPTPLPFTGTITGGCSTDVLIDGKPAAVVGSTATNNPPHVAPNGQIQIPPTNQGTVFLDRVRGDEPSKHAGATGRRPGADLQRPGARADLHDPGRGHRPDRLTAPRQLSRCRRS